MKNKIGYLGGGGSFSWVAAKEIQGHFPVPQTTFSDLFKSLTSKELDKIIVPIENSIDGHLNNVYDLLLDHKNIRIVEMLDMPINHFLIAHKISQISTIVSHTQPLQQCAKYIAKKHPKADVLEMPSTYAAAQYCMDNPGAAMIGSIAILSNFPNMKILDENIQDYKNNRTRFALIQMDNKEYQLTRSPSFVSIAFSCKNNPGALYSILEAFIKQDTNITRISSRPQKTKQGEYMFFIEYCLTGGHPFILEHIRNQCSYSKFLGVYNERICSEANNTRL